MKNINEKFLCWLNVTTFTFSFADAIEWALRVFLLVVTIVISWPKFEGVVKNYYKKFRGE